MGIFDGSGGGLLGQLGFLDATTAADTIYRVSAFRDGLKEAGFIDGHNIAIEFRWAENKYDRLPVLAADLAQRQVAVIVGPSIASRRRVGAFGGEHVAGCPLFALQAP
jgi:hypothetical protein